MHTHVGWAIVCVAGQNETLACQVAASLEETISRALNVEVGRVKIVAFMQDESDSSELAKTAEEGAEPAAAAPAPCPKKARRTMLACQIPRVCDGCRWTSWPPHLTPVQLRRRKRPSNTRRRCATVRSVNE